MGPQPPLVTIADLKLNKIKFSNFVQNCNFFALKIVQKQKLDKLKYLLGDYKIIVL